MRDIRRTAVTEQFRILKMPFRVIFSILNNLSLRRNVYLNIQNFTRENKPLFSKRFFLYISGRHVGAPQRGISILSLFCSSILFSNNWHFRHDFILCNSIITLIRNICLEGNPQFPCLTILQWSICIFCQMKG